MGPTLPLKKEELKNFEDALKSSRTIKVQRSHLRKVAGYLRREFPTKTCGKSDNDILRSLSSPEAFKHVAAAVGMDGIGSGAHYLSTWACMLDDEGRLPPGTNAKRKRYAKAFSTFGRDYSQAKEFSLDKVLLSDNIWDRAPLCPGGAIFPSLAVGIVTMLMLRVLTTRSMRRKQIRMLLQGRVEIVFGERTNQQAGNRRRLRRTISLECVCGIWDHACVACKIKRY